VHCYLSCECASECLDVEKRNPRSKTHNFGARLPVTSPYGDTARDWELEASLHYLLDSARRVLSML